ncbi:hypothetical protein ACET3X_000117 [Alternaria dauci]|uniref:Uncharacterized protein n=1 Tax=Alternaria dauci TaxID=48095 RepID=A0ABR3UUQ4_9PLEO
MEEHRDSTSAEPCQLIKLESHIPRKAASPEYNFAFAYKRPRPIPKTWEWMGSKDSTGLLDLSPTTATWADDDCVPGEEPIVFQNCNIMRVCRQVHWEFAEVLYARPLQLTGVPCFTNFPIVVTGSHVLPLSKTYAHLVKRLAFIHTTGLSDFFEADDLYGEGRCPSAQALLLDIITATKKLLKLFPALQVLRILVDDEPFENLEMFFDSLLGRREGTREELVDKTEEFIKAVGRRLMKIPQQLELLLLEGGVPKNVPLSEAFRNMQAAELHKKRLKENS